MPRLNHSNTRIIGQYLVDTLAEPVVSRDLAQQPLPPISAEDLIAVHGSLDSERASLQTQLALSETLIDELKNADTLVIGAPMYNFGIPASLKQWIDAICRAGVSFKYTEQGPVGLLGVKTGVHYHRQRWHANWQRDGFCQPLPGAHLSLSRYC